MFPLLSVLVLKLNYSSGQTSKKIASAKKSVFLFEIGN